MPDKSKAKPPIKSSINKVEPPTLKSPSVFTFSQPKFTRKVESENTQLTFSVAKSQESTRAKIAKTFTFFFLFMVFLSLVGPFILDILNPGTFTDPLESAKTITTTVAGVLGGPFGFIVGFYFKQTNDEG
ncbi:MAG: hypothetical protein PVJ09_00745 [Candidatus Woesebacteria bacterium]|jgi:hypothetical protein